jgi:molecular chaperone DnaK (HSP70)
MADVIVGIDLGTTNSLVAHCDERGPRIIAAPDGRRHLPSVVYLGVGGEVEVGQGARDRAVERPTETVYSVKRLMGRGLADVAGELAFLPYQVVPHVGGDAGDSAMVDVEVHGVRHTPQEISATILRELKGWAEAHFGHEVKKAVVTVPAYFDDAQRQATRDAGAIAGLDVVRIVNEPTAAALAYGLDRTNDGIVAIYDLGGGTFDVSILKIENGVFRVLATHGDTHLGGDDFDREVVTLVQREISAQLSTVNHQPSTPLVFPPSTRQAMRTFAENVKIRLSTEPTATLEIDLGGGETYRRTITREEFLGLIRPHVARSLERCAVAIRDAGNPKIDRVVMVGGSTYVPLVREEVARVFGVEAYTALNPMEVVALGAAVQGGILARVSRDLLLQDIVPLSLGIETMGGAVAKLITKGRAVPCMADEIFSTYVDGQTQVKIHVLQGERELVADCRSLGEFVLSGIPPMPAGLPKIRVRFLVDANAVLNVSATEERSGTRASIQVVPTYGLTRDEVGKMVRDSVAHAREDMLAHRLIDLRNQITLDATAIRKSLATVGGDIDPAYRDELLGKLAQLDALAQGTDANAIQQALNDLDTSSVALAEQAISKTLRG